MTRLDFSDSLTDDGERLGPIGVTPKNKPLAGRRWPLVHFELLSVELRPTDKADSVKARLGLEAAQHVGLLGLGDTLGEHGAVFVGEGDLVDCDCTHCAHSLPVILKIVKHLIFIFSMFVLGRESFLSDFVTIGRTLGYL